MMHMLFGDAFSWMLQRRRKDPCDVRVWRERFARLEATSDKKRCEQFNFVSRLSTFHFALKFSSRDSSPWTVLKRRLFRFSRLRIFHFALNFNLLTRQFTVGCSQGETSIFVSLRVLHFALKFCSRVRSSVLKRIFSRLQFTLKFFSQDSSPWTVLKGRLKFFSLLRVFHFALKFSSRDSSLWTVLKGKLRFFSLLRVFNFALKFSSRDSSLWTVLKGKLQFFSLLRVFHFALKFSSRDSSSWTVLRRLELFSFHLLFGVEVLFAHPLLSSLHWELRFVRVFWMETWQWRVLLVDIFLTLMFLDFRQRLQIKFWMFIHLSCILTWTGREKKSTKSRLCPWGIRAKKNISSTPQKNPLSLDFARGV